MKLRDYFYHLPKESIAQHPSKERDKCRLLVLDRSTGGITHRHFFEIGKHLQQGDLLVINNTKVIPARLVGYKPTEGKIEILLIARIPGGEERWKALINKRKGLLKGFKIHFKGSDTLVEIAEIREDHFEITFIFQKGSDIKSFILQNGYAPLPPYIKRKHENTAEDKEDILNYQTVFAKYDGSIAAPTAGLHFTPELISELKNSGVTFTEVTLHVGTGTFKPIKVENVEDHKMEREYYEISKTAADDINRAKTEGRRVIAVGTTAIRTLESAYAKQGRITEDSGWSELYITEGGKFGVI
ncbi:MAG: tRNA preQ1(34) S-adenosylmethionine ribosyltransferase-isomerase QueA, partial [Candidatus Firestonebacteria bacterium]